MSFNHAWILFIAWIPLAWIAWEWRHTERKLGLLLKGVSFFAILLALAEPRVLTDETKVALAVLVDTSGSTTPEDLAAASQKAAAVQAAKGRHSVQVIPFARGTRPLTATEKTGGLKLTATSGEAGRGSDLEGAVREAIASVPAGMVPRVLLMSDGKENHGSLVRAAWQARELRTPIDTFLMQGRAKPALRLESVTMPMVAFTGEQFPIDLLVSTPKATDAQIELAAEGHALGQGSFKLQAGPNPVQMHASLNTPGALDISITVRSSSLGEVRFDQAVMLRQPKILYISGDAAEQDTHLPEALRAAQFDLTRLENINNANVKLSDYQLVVFNNWDLDSVSAPIKSSLETFVKQGGGLLVVGGEHNVYNEAAAKSENPLAKTLPAVIAPPRSPEGIAVVLIVDKSSSMEGRKMELARLAAIGAVQNLRPIDMVGVLIFDNTFEWAVPIRRAEDKNLIKRLIAGITPDGGTQIPPALAEAYKRILPQQANYKHIVLMTDGISEEGDAQEVAKEAGLKHVTISSVGIGMDVNKNFLEKIALTAGGKAYFLTDPSMLEQILIKDVQEHTGSTAVEKPLNAEVSHMVESLSGVGMEAAPALKGYIRFEAKPSAQTVLKIDTRDPLLSRWQYGLGRSAVFASDAKERWAADWITWKGYDRFWSNVARDLLPHAQAGEAHLDFDAANSTMLVEYRLGDGVPEPAPIPAIYVFGPNNFRQPVEVKKVASGTFQGRVAIGDRQGLFRVRPEQDNLAFPEAGLYRPEAELSDYGSNATLLKQVAAFTGGKYNPSPSDVFEAGKRSVPTIVSLWPAFLGLGVILSLAELVLRKWKGVVAAA